MMAASLIGSAGTALPFLGAGVLAILVAVHRRGRARVIGFLGAVLIALGILFPPVVGIVGMRPVPSSPGAMASGYYGIPILDFTLQAAPGILMGLGVILVVASSGLIPRGAPEYPRP